MQPTDAISAKKLVELFEKLKSENSSVNWWNNYIMFEWNNLRSSSKSSNNTDVRWMSIKYRTDIANPFKNLIVTVVDEINKGSIIPVRQEDIALMPKKEGKQPVPRTQKPCLNFQKYTIPVQTQPDGISLIMKDGKPVYPDDSYRSNYFRFVEFMSIIMEHEIGTRIERGIEYMRELKLLGKYDEEKIQQIKKALNIEDVGDIIINTNDKNTLAKKFSSDLSKILDKAHIVPNTKIVNLIQWNISNSSANSAGLPLPNPITRVAIPFDLKEHTLPNNFKICTKVEEHGKPTFPEFLINGERITNYTVHQAFPYNTSVDGFISFDSICFSNMGISIPTKFVLAIVVKPPESKVNNITAICSALYNTKPPEEENYNSNSSNGNDNDDVFAGIN